MKYQDGLRILKKGEDNRFILSGSEPFLKYQFIEKALSLNSEKRPLFFYENSWQEAVESISTESLFGNRLIILFDFDKMHPEKFDGFIDKTGDKVIMSLSEKAKKTRILTKFVSISISVTCNKMREYGKDYPNWISSVAMSFGYMMKKESEDIIYSMVGPNMFSIYNELKKIFLYKGENKDIYPEDVYLVVSKTAISSSYDFLNNLLNKDIEGALRTFNSYYKNHLKLGELVYFLFMYFEKIYRMILLREDGLTVDDISDIIGIPKFLVRSLYLPKAVSLGKKKIEQSLNKISELEINLRKFNGDKKVLIEHFIMCF